MEIKVTYKGNGVSKTLSLLDAMLIHNIGPIQAIQLDNGYTLADDNFIYKAVWGFDGRPVNG